MPPDPPKLRYEMRRGGNGTLQQKSNRRESFSPGSATEAAMGMKSASPVPVASLLLLRVRWRGLEVDRDARLVTDNPGVVSGFDPSHVAPQPDRQARCGCLPECICQRSALGRAFRWYIPGRFHAPVPPEQKARVQTEGRHFGEA
jgi:hypothetical protein